MAIVWKITPPAGWSAVENDDLSGFAVGQFTAVDDANAITYSLASGDTDYFDITASGQLQLKSAFDADNAINGVFSVVVKATSTNGDISSTFILSADNINESLTQWSGSPPTNIAVSETANVANQGELTAGNYVAFATLLDADGDGFEYAMDQSKPGWWLFDISSDGVLSVKYALDYESTFYPPVISATAWVHGTAGGDGVGDGITWISHNFTLNIGNVDESVAWSADTNTDIDATFDEVAGGFGNVAVGNYTAIDPDGTAVTYGITGDAAAYFSITSDGTLWAISNIDYEKAPAGDGVYAITVTAESGGGTPITANLVWNLNNINDESISWAGVESSAAISETINVANQGDELATYIPLATLAPTDPDGAGFEYAIDQSQAGWW
ncbi:MAG: hypothetical protein ACR2PV_09450, partial [Gammaproteobacteria bacterium]